MLLILMYHRVEGIGAPAGALRQHLTYLVDHHPLVWPGDPLPRGELAVCLTFDDATADFHHAVFPLLEDLNARALVAVPTRHVEPDTDAPWPTRLAAQTRAIQHDDYATPGSPLCTWRELRAMQASGRVRCVAHGHAHVPLTHPGVDLDQELKRPRERLHDELGIAPDTFVFPYGRTSPALNRRVLSHYRYAMRIGSALNRDWTTRDGLLYRVDAEHFWPRGRRVTWRHQAGYALKYLTNRLRGR